MKSMKIDSFEETSKTHAEADRRLGRDWSCCCAACVRIRHGKSKPEYLESIRSETEAAKDLRDLHDNKELRDAGYVKSDKASTGVCHSCGKKCGGTRGWEFRFAGTILVRQCRQCAIDAVINDTFPFGG